MIFGGPFQLLPFRDSKDLSISGDQNRVEEYVSNPSAWCNTKERPALPQVSRGGSLLVRADKWHFHLIPDVWGGGALHLK